MGRWSITFLVFALIFPAFAEEDHTPPVSSETKAQVSTQSSGVPLLTRQEALIRGLRDIGLSQPALQTIVRVTEKAPGLTNEKFGGVVNNLVQNDRALTQEQGDALKELYKKELGVIEDPNVGSELSSAARSLLAAQGAGNGGSTLSPIPKKNAGEIENVGNQKAAQNNSGLGAITGGLNPAILDKLVQGPQRVSETARLEELLANQLKANAEQAASAGKKGKGGDRDKDDLLKTLRAALAEAKNGKKDEKGERGDRGFDPREELRDLKNALTHGPPPPRKDKDDDGQKEDPRPPKKEKPEQPSVANLFKNQGKNDSKEKDKKDDEKERIPPFRRSKEDASKDKVDVPPPSKDKEKKGGELPGLDDGKVPPPIPPTDFAEKEKGSPLNPLPRPGGSSGSDGFFGGSGGGSAAAPILGSTSPMPSGGGFDGGVFNGLGESPGWNAGAGSLSVKKPEYGTSSGGGDFSSVDTTSTSSAFDDDLYGNSRSARNAVTKIQLASYADPQPKELQEKTMRDYFFKLYPTVCLDGAVNSPDVCKRVVAKRLSKRH